MSRNHPEMRKGRLSPSAKDAKGSIVHHRRLSASANGVKCNLAHLDEMRGVDDKTLICDDLDCEQVWVTPRA